MHSDETPGGCDAAEHHLICDGRGTPLQHHRGQRQRLTRTLALVDGIPPVGGRPGRPRRRPESVLGDKVYDSKAVRRELRRRRIMPVISRKGALNIQGLGKLRYVVEEALALRWERRVGLHDAFLPSAGA